MELDLWWLMTPMAELSFPVAVVLAAVGVRWLITDSGRGQ